MSRVPLRDGRRKPGPKPVSLGTKMFSVLASLSPPDNHDDLPFPQSLDGGYRIMERDYSDSDMNDLIPGTRRRMERLLWELKKQGYVDTMPGRRSHWTVTVMGRKALAEACKRFDKEG